MANEVTKVTLLGNAGDPVEYTVDDTIAVPKGTIMKFGSSPQTALAATADNDFICGIASCEKKADDGVTKLALWTHGVFDMYSTSGMTLGQPQKLEGANAITDADDDTIAQREEVVGLALETVGVTARGAVLIFK